MFLDELFSMCLPTKKSLSDICKDGDTREFNRRRVISYEEITSPDHSGRIPLLCAVGEGKIQIVKRMMKIGNICNFSNIHGWNILHEAVSGGSVGMVEYILENCYMKTYIKTSGGYSPIHMAIMDGRCDILKILLRYTPFNMVSLPTKCGATPLILAIICKNREMICILHDSGASLISESYNGFSALYLSRYYGVMDTVSKLCNFRISRVSGFPLSRPVFITY